MQFLRLLTDFDKTLKQAYDTYYTSIAMCSFTLVVKATLLQRLNRILQQIQVSPDNILFRWQVGRLPKNKRELPKLVVSFGNTNLNL
jgi:hypothetical protein